MHYIKTLILAFILPILLTSAIWSGDALSVVLVTSKTVRDAPQLEFVDSANAIHDVPLSGTAPGRIFNGELAWENVAAGTGEFRIVPGTMLDMAGNSGTEITKGRYYSVPNRVNAVLYHNRKYNFVTGRLETP